MTVNAFSVFGDWMTENYPASKTRKYVNTVTRTLIFIPPPLIGGALSDAFV